MWQITEGSFQHRLAYPAAYSRLIKYENASTPSNMINKITILSYENGMFDIIIYYLNHSDIFKKLQLAMSASGTPGVRWSGIHSVELNQTSDLAIIEQFLQVLSSIQSDLADVSNEIIDGIRSIASLPPAERMPIDSQSHDLNDVLEIIYEPRRQIPGQPSFFVQASQGGDSMVQRSAAANVVSLLSESTDLINGAVASTAKLSSVETAAAECHRLMTEYLKTHPTPAPRGLFDDRESEIISNSEHNYRRYNILQRLHEFLRLNFRKESLGREVLEDEIRRLSVSARFPDDVNEHMIAFSQKLEAAKLDELACIPEWQWRLLWISTETGIALSELLQWFMPCPDILVELLKNIRGVSQLVGGSSLRLYDLFHLNEATRACLYQHVDVVLVLINEGHVPFDQLPALSTMKDDAILLLTHPIHLRALHDGEVALVRLAEMTTAELHETSARRSISM